MSSTNMLSSSPDEGKFNDEINNHHKNSELSDHALHYMYADENIGSNASIPTHMLGPQQPFKMMMTGSSSPSSASVPGPDRRVGSGGPPDSGGAAGADDGAESGATTQPVRQQQRLNSFNGQPIQFMESQMYQQVHSQPGRASSYQQLGLSQQQNQQLHVQQQPQHLQPQEYQEQLNVQQYQRPQHSQPQQYQQHLSTQPQHQSHPQNGQSNYQESLPQNQFIPNYQQMGVPPFQGVPYFGGSPPQGGQYGMYGHVPPHVWQQYYSHMMVPGLPAQARQLASRYGANTVYSPPVMMQSSSGVNPFYRASPPLQGADAMIPGEHINVDMSMEQIPEQGQMQANQFAGAVPAAKMEGSFQAAPPVLPAPQTPQQEKGPRKRDPEGLKKELQKLFETVKSPEDLGVEYRRIMRDIDKDTFAKFEPEEFELGLQFAVKYGTKAFWDSFDDNMAFFARMRNWMAAMIRNKKTAKLIRALYVLEHLPITWDQITRSKLDSVLEKLQKIGDDMIKTQSARLLAMKKGKNVTSSSNSNQTSNAAGVNATVANAKPAAAGTMTAKSSGTTSITGGNANALDKKPKGIPAVVEKKVTTTTNTTNPNTGGSSSFGFFKNLQATKSEKRQPSGTPAAVKSEAKPTVGPTLLFSGKMSIKNQLQNANKDNEKRKSPSIDDQTAGKEQGTAKKRKKKTVAWRDDNLVEVREFEAEYDTAHRSAYDARDFERDEANAARLRHYEPETELLDWYPPASVHIDAQAIQKEYFDSNSSRRGGRAVIDSPEAKIQQDRESQLPVELYDANLIPDSPKEPKEEANYVAPGHRPRIAARAPEVNASPLVQQLMSSFEYEGNSRSLSPVIPQQQYQRPQTSSLQQSMPFSSDSKIPANDNLSAILEKLNAQFSTSNNLRTIPSTTTNTVSESNQAQSNVPLSEILQNLTSSIAKNTEQQNRATLAAPVLPPPDSNNKNGNNPSWSISQAQYPYVTVEEVLKRRRSDIRPEVQQCDGQMDKWRMRCRFFDTGGCQRGDSCGFLHIQGQHDMHR